MAWFLNISSYFLKMPKIAENNWCFELLIKYY